MRSALLLTLVALTSAGCSKRAQSYVDLGNRYQAQHKLDDAAIQYRKALQKDPALWEAYYRLGLILREQSQFRPAWVEFHRAADLAPANPDVRRDLAALTLAAYLARGAGSQAFHDDLAKQADWFLAQPGGSFDAWRLKMYLAMSDRHPDEAGVFAAKANAAKPWEADVTLLWVQALLQVHQDEQAEQVARDFFSHGKGAPGLYDVMYAHYMSRKRTAEAESVLAGKADAFPADAGVRIQLAAHYHQSGQRDKEAAELAVLLDHPDRFRSGRLAVAEYRLRTGSPDQAVKLLEAAARSDREDALPCSRLLAEFRAGQGDRAGALEIAKQGLSRFPSDALLTWLKSSLLLDSGTKEARKEALDGLTALVDKSPRDGAARYLRGRALAAQGRVPEALSELRESIGLDPTAIQPRVALAELELYGGSAKEALKTLDDALGIAPDHLAARDLRVAALRMNGHYKEASEALKELEQKFPGNVGLAIERANLNLLQNRTAEAEATFRKLYHPGQENLRPLMGLVECRLRQKDAAGAERLLEADLAQAPGCPFVRTLLGDTLTAAGKPDRAAAQYEQALHSAPGSPLLYRRLGELYFALGDSGKAITNLQKSLEYNPASVLTVSLLAQQYDRAGQAADAERYYRRWLELEPASIPAQNNLAFLLAENGKLDEALTLATKACQKAGQVAPVSDTLGWVYLKKKMTPSALEIFRGLVRRYPDIATFRYHLGLALIASGDRPCNRSELETALRKHPSRTEETQIRHALAGAS